MDTLKLVLIGKWFDLIHAGIKQEEYREITDYWCKRLFIGGDLFKPKPFTHVTFYHGYRKDRRTITVPLCIHWVGIGCGAPEWGAELGKEYFVISLNNQRAA